MKLLAFACPRSVVVAGLLYRGALFFSRGYAGAPGPGWDFDFSSQQAFCLVAVDVSAPFFYVFGTPSRTDGTFRSAFLFMRILFTLCYGR